MGASAIPCPIPIPSGHPHPHLQRQLYRRKWRKTVSQKNTKKNRELSEPTIWVWRISPAAPAVPSEPEPWQA